MGNKFSLTRSRMWRTRAATALAAAGALVMSGGLVMLAAPTATATVNTAPCVPKDAWTETTGWVTESPGEGWTKTDERKVVDSPAKDATEGHWEGLQWYNWNPGGDQWVQDADPPLNDDRWHATQGDPHSDVHSVELRGVNDPYFVSNENSGNGDWFVWKGTWVEGTEATPEISHQEYKFSFNHPAVTCPEGPDYYLETSHTVACGTATITLRNVSPWIYPVSYSTDGSTPNADGPDYGPVVDNRGEAPDDQTGSKTLTFPEDSGVVTVKYVVAAGTESDLYSNLPVGQVTTFTVQTDCRPNTPGFVPETQTESRTVDGTLDCTAGTVQQLLQQRSRTEVSDGVWGAWSDWTTVSTSTRPATATECPVVAGVEEISPTVSFTEPTCKKLNGANWSGTLKSIVDYTIEGTPGLGETVTVTATIKPSMAAQFAFPAGFDNTFDYTYVTEAQLACPTVKGSETSRPKPQKPAEQPTVLGTQAVAPTAVAAGLAGLPATGSSSNSLLAQLLVGGGLVLLLAGGWLGFGRREHGAHQA